MTIPSGQNCRAAMLWDESFLWGIMACKALASAGLACDLVRASDIRDGALSRYALLFVPGGWASNKIKALGDEGVARIKEFVSAGGSYVGFCGGAGLATQDGIGLLPIKRRPTKDRVPSFSGRIRMTLTPHPIWQGISGPIFHAWWPSQFVADESLSILAAYENAMPDAFSSDLNVGDTEAIGGWTDLERLYGINLDPRRLTGEPAVVEGVFGSGTVLLSLLHFDTPDDADGAIVLRNIWNRFVPGQGAHSRGTGVVHRNHALEEASRRMRGAIVSLMELGRRNFLWFQRNALLTQWRRGVRGLEYCNLYGMIDAMLDALSCVEPTECDAVSVRVHALEQRLYPFLEQAGRLLLLERTAMANGHITYERCDDREIQAIREQLFSRSKSYGGQFKTILDEMDSLLFSLLVRGVR